MVVDLFLVFQFIRKLVTPFDKWPAYEQGIIDDKGNVLIKRKRFTKKAQRQAFGVFDQMILNIKKLLAKLPGGSSRLGSYAAALWLIKEYKSFSEDEMLNESYSDQQLDEATENFVKWYMDYITLEENVNQLNEKDVEEDAPTVNVGGGAIAGLGVGSQGEPGLSRAAQKKHKKRTLKTFKAVRKEKENE